MRPISLSGGHGFNGFNAWRRRFEQMRGGNRTNSSSSSGASTSGRGSYLERVKGFQGPLKAALTSGTLSAAGDLLVQALTGQLDKTKEAPPYNPMRTARMFGYGFAFYGPYQFYWYNLLEWLMPVKTTATFLAKVAANQILLAPVVLSTVFAWNLALTGHADAIMGKLERDLLPTMMNGWKFWIPAASINFYAVPLAQQVLYMSCCGVLWTAYLSHASVNDIAKPTKQQVIVDALQKKGAKKK